MRTRTLLLLSLLIALPLCAETKLTDLAWMSGHWAATIDGVEMEEIWSSPAGGLLIGMHRDIGVQRTSFEFFRIAETKDGIVYLTQPGGRPATPFRLSEASANRVVFANPEHDFPKRILYWLQDGKLCARIEGDGQESNEQWCWAKR
jgi:hypothetical protein